MFDLFASAGVGMPLFARHRRSSQIKHTFVDDITFSWTEILCALALDLLLSHGRGGTGGGTGAGAGFQGIDEYDNAKLLSGARSTPNGIHLHIYMVLGNLQLYLCDMHVFECLFIYLFIYCIKNFE